MLSWTVEFLTLRAIERRTVSPPLATLMPSISGCVAIGLADLRSGVLVDRAGASDEALEGLGVAHAVSQEAITGPEGRAVASILGRLRGGSAPPPESDGPTSGWVVAESSRDSACREVILRYGNMIHVLTPCPEKDAHALLLVCTGVNNLGRLLAEARQAARSCTL